MISGNAMACINGQCFGNAQGAGQSLGSTQEAFTPVTNQEGNIEAIETLKEWFKFLGLPLGGIGGANTTLEDIQNSGFGQGFASAGALGAFAGTINMSGLMLIEVFNGSSIGGCLTCLTIRSIKELMIQPEGDFSHKHKNFLRAKIGSEF